MTKIQDEQLHDLRQHIYTLIVSNGYATNKEEAKNVAKFNGLLLNKVDYAELKTKALKFDKIKEILSKSIDKVDFLTQLLYITYVKS